MNEITEEQELAVLFSKNKGKITFSLFDWVLRHEV